jgi:hypothetical protein
MHGQINGVCSTVKSSGAGRGAISVSLNTNGHTKKKLHTVAMFYKASYRVFTTR